MGFIINLLLGLLINIEWGIPALILLILHFVFDISILWFIGALVAWVLLVIVSMLIVGFSAKCSNIKDPPKENKNIYSAKNK